MKYVAAYLLSVLGGNPSPSATDIGKILASVGAECDSSRADTLVSSIGERDVFELISEGMSKLSSVPSVGAATSTSSVSASTGSASASASAPASSSKKEETPKEESEDEDMGFDLFG